MSAHRGGIVGVAANFLAGLAFVHSGLAGWLWEHVEREVPWRTGPTWDRVLAYLAIYWLAWLIGNPAGRARAVVAARCLITSCVLIVIQVLTPTLWLPVTLAILLIAMLIDACIVRERFAPTLTAWAWSGAGVALATLLVHPYFVGLPLFVVRLAVLMTLWDFVGGRLGVSRRVTRFVPSLYCCGSGCTADQARVAK